MNDTSVDNALNKRFALTLLNGVALLASLGLVVWLMLRAPSLENQFWIAIISTVVGGLLQQHAQSQGWWFGSTKGASDQSATLRDIASGKTSPPNGGAS